MGEERQDPSGGLMYNQPPATDETYFICTKNCLMEKHTDLYLMRVFWFISLKQLLFRALVCTIVVKTSIVHPKGPGIFQLRCRA